MNSQFVHKDHSGDYNDAMFKIPELDVDLAQIDEEELKSTVRINSNRSGLPEVNLNYFGNVLNANMCIY